MNLSTIGVVLSYTFYLYVLPIIFSYILNIPVELKLNVSAILAINDMLRGDYHKISYC